MPLNYSKWDHIELSDDSDVEVHPNVDKRSFIRWKQRDIHEKREQRRLQYEQLKAEQITNESLRPRLVSLQEGIQSTGSPYFEQEYGRLTEQRKANGNKDSGPGGKPSTDDLILKLLNMIKDEDSVKKASSSSSSSSSQDQVATALITQVDSNLSKLDARQVQIDSQLKAMDEEDKRKITTDGIREGWSSGHVSKPEDTPEPEVVKPKAAKTKEKVTQIETLNSPSASSSTSAPAASSTEDDDDDEDLPELTPTLNAWIDLPTVLPNFPLTTTALPPSYNPAKSLDSRPFEVALKFLAAHKQLITTRVPTAQDDDQDPTDACLFEAFQAQMQGKADRARRCVEKGLMLQYCRKLGPDGVNLFFRKMMGGEPKAAILYINDVFTTYTRIVDRAGALSEKHGGNESGEVEQIQLVPENENTVITFTVPSEPPALEDLKVELPTVEEIEAANERARAEGRPEMPILTVADVHELLTRRFEIFNSLKKELQDAIRSEKLEEVNKVLGDMPVAEAEEAVRLMDEANILDFNSGADGDVIVDQTGK
ncbi:hsp90 co-chaperone Cdc37 [Tilletia horrida]|nr:hsp90 co-chaperone Cdc37 [Tilletia horrida]